MKHASLKSPYASGGVVGPVHSWVNAIPTSSSTVVSLKLPFATLAS